MSRDVAATMRAAAASLRRATPVGAQVPIRVGVDLGTAYTVIMVTDEVGQPLAGASVFADVVRDGVVWDFSGAQQIVRSLKADVERRISRTLSAGAVTIPPGVTKSDARAHSYVLEGAGIECGEVVDEPTAANAVLGIENGAVVDVGGGTTGVAVFRDGAIVDSWDEPSGGTHMSLVIAGARRISFDEAEQLKRDPTEQQALLPVVLPVLNKYASIVAAGLSRHPEVDQIHLVGGTSAFPGLAAAMTRATGIPCTVAPEPMLVTPLGVSSWARPITETRY